MKKYDLLKVIGITFLVVILLSWVIPAGIFSNGAYSSSEAISPIGLYDIFSAPAVAFASFVQYGILFLTIGGFYGILNKTGVYTKIVEGIIKKWKNNSNKFLIISIITFALLSSIIGINNVIFILVPFFITILLKLGYNKMTAFAATVGAMLVGSLGTTFGFGIWGYIRMGFGLKMTEIILVRIILLVIITTLFILLVKKNSQIEKNVKNTKTENLDIPLYEESNSKRDYFPLVLVLGITLFILVLGTYNWESAFSIDFFTKLYESVTTVEIAGLPILDYILGSVSKIGYWGDYDIIVTLIISSLIIGWLYSIKLSDIISSFVDGAKQMVVPAIYSMLASIILVVVSNLGANFVFTLVNTFTAGTEQFTFIGTVGSALVTSAVYNNFYVLIGNFYQVFSLYDANVIPAIAFIFQTIYGIVMLIAPTSMLLLVGLTYLRIPYQEWVKYIWKFLLIVLGIVIIISFIIATFI